MRVAPLLAMTIRRLSPKGTAYTGRRENHRFAPAGLPLSDQPAGVEGRQQQRARAAGGDATKIDQRNESHHRWLVPSGMAYSLRRGARNEDYRFGRRHPRRDS